jgi:hypothetical protein
MNNDSKNRIGDLQELHNKIFFRNCHSGPHRLKKSKNTPWKGNIIRTSIFPIITLSNNIMWIISKLVGRSDPSPCCPGKKAGAEDKKGRAQLSLIPPLCFRKEGRGERDSRAETAGVRLGKRGTTAFFGEANDFLPGHGNTWP